MHKVLDCILGRRDGIIYVPISAYATMPQYVFDECLLRNIDITVVADDDSGRFTFVPIQQNNKRY